MAVFKGKNGGGWGESQWIMEGWRLDSTSFSTAYRLMNPQFESLLDSGPIFQNAYLSLRFSMFKSICNLLFPWKKKKRHAFSHHGIVFVWWWCDLVGSFSVSCLRCNDLILRCVMGCFWKIYAHYFFKSYSALQEGGYSLLLEIATAFLAWEISWTEEPGGLQSTGSQNMTQRLNNCYIRLFTIAQGHTDSVHYFFSLFLTVLQFPQVLLSCLPLHFSLSLFFKLVN